MVAEADMPNFVSNFPPAGRQVVVPHHSEGAHAIPLYHFQPLKFGSSTPILQFLKDLISTSLHKRQSAKASTLLLIHPLDVFVSCLHTSSFHDQLSRRNVDAWLSHTTLVFSSQQSSHGLQSHSLSQLLTLSFAYFKTFPAIPASSLCRCSMEAEVSSTKPSTSAQCNTEKQTAPVGTCELHRASLLCGPLLSSLVWCRCCVDLSLLVSMDTFAAQCAHFHTQSHPDKNDLRLTIFPQKAEDTSTTTAHVGPSLHCRYPQNHRGWP